jgi:hypothetical protein
MELLEYQCTGIYPLEGQNWNLWIVGIFGYHKGAILSFQLCPIYYFLVINL